MGNWSTLAQWPRRRWAAAAAWALGTVLVVALPTALLPNPVFDRAIPPTAWAWPALIVTAVLSGLLAATYVRGGEVEEAEVPRAGLVGGFLAYLAVGCPVCNKLALLALGYSGAVQWFAPVQPVLAVLGVAVLGYALHRRLAGEVACPVRIEEPLQDVRG